MDILNLQIVLFIVIAAQIVVFIYVLAKSLSAGTMNLLPFAGGEPSLMSDNSEFEKKKNDDSIKMIEQFRKHHNISFYLLWSVIVLTILIGGYIIVYSFMIDPKDVDLWSNAIFATTELSLTIGSWKLYRYTYDKYSELLNGN